MYHSTFPHNLLLQITLDLPSECRFLELQSLICQAIKVPPPQQRIRHGFPPRELKPPATPAEDYKVPIQPGDKIMLDILVPQQGAGSTSSQDSGHSHTCQLHIFLYIITMLYPSLFCHLSFHFLILVEI